MPAGNVVIGAVSDRLAMPVIIHRVVGRRRLPGVNVPEIERSTSNTIQVHEGGSE